MAIIDDKKRNQIWKDNYGSQKTATDAFGRRMTKENFQVDHIYPQAKGGSSAKSNLQALAPLSNQEKSDKLSGKVNGKTFSVTKTANSGSLKVGSIKVKK